MKHWNDSHNTAQGEYIVDTCQLTRDGLSYFPVHYHEYDQGWGLITAP